MNDLSMKSTADIADQYASVAKHCTVQFQHFGTRHYFSGEIETIKTMEDAGLVIKALSQPGLGRVLVIDGQGSLHAALVGDRLTKWRSRTIGRDW